jgi:hypothetical protein
MYLFLTLSITQSVSVIQCQFCQNIKKYKFHVENVTSVSYYDLVINIENFEEFSLD